MHMVVDAEDDDVILPHEVDLRFVERDIADDRHVVAIVPVGVFVRDDRLAPRHCPLERSNEQNTVVAMPLTSTSGPPNEGVAIRGIAPRRADILLDAIDTSAAVIRLDFQYGSPAGTCRIGTSGTNVSASSRRPPCPALRTRAPQDERLFVAGEHFVARIQPTPTHALHPRRAINQWERLQGRLNRRGSRRRPTRCTLVCGSPMTRMPPRAFSPSARVPPACRASARGSPCGAGHRWFRLSPSQAPTQCRARAVPAGGAASARSSGRRPACSWR